MNQMQRVHQKKFQDNSSGQMCRGFYFIKFLAFFFFIFFGLNSSVFAENTFVFSTEPQSIAVGEMSGKINVQSSEPVTETTYLNFTSSSATGQFLNGSGNPLTSSYISNGDSNRAVYYKDTTKGDFIITAVVLSKDKTKELATITQHIYIGVQSDTSVSSSTSTSTTTPQTESVNNSTNNQTQIYSAHSSPSSLSSTENKMEFEVSAGRNRLTSVGNSILFQAVPTKLQNVTSNNITYSWSFGDGTLVQGNNISHSYKFSGEYFVVVNASYSDKQAVSRILVKVVEPKILLNRVVGGIELLNNSGFELNLENWKLVSQTKNFVFPKDTLLPNNKKIIFADEVTGINLNNVKIENPLGKKYAEAYDSTDIIIATTTPQVDTDYLLEKLKDNTEKIALLSKKMVEEKNQNSEKILVSTKDMAIKNENKLKAKESIDEKIKNTAIVFEASKSNGLLDKIFTLPVAGFNFIRDLFVEK